MPGPPGISLLYGPTGSPTLQSRFSIEGQPFNAIPLTAAGFTSNRPAHLLGLSGAAYRYGGTVVNGSKNLLPIDGVVVSLPPFSNSLSTVSFDLGVVTGTNSPFHVPLQSYTTRYLYAATATMMVGGEVIGAGVPGATEAFTTAGTVAITNGSATVTGTGSSWTTNTLTFAYGYTPALNLIYPGDLLRITHPVSGTVYYRIYEVTDNTHLKVFPTPAEATASGMAYSILRTGFGSYSRVIQLGTNPTYYYAGMNYATFANSAVNSTIMAYDATLGTKHVMGPTGVSAQDIAYYRSYLLYGNGSTVGWTVPGFPTTSPFASADFPASSISVLDTDPQDTFVSFEYLGDQLIAIFTRSIFVVQINPGQLQANAFSFYRFPEKIGSIVPVTNGVTSVDPTLQIPGATGSHFRPTCSADGAVYYLSSEGLMELSAGKQTADVVSSDVADILPHCATLHWDPVSDTIIVEQYGDPMLVYARQTGQWYLATWQNCFGPSDNRSSRRDVGRMLRWVRYNGTAIVGTEVDQTTTNFDRPYASPTDAWTWASPVVNLSDQYPDFQMGGLRIDAEAPGVSTANVTYTIYGGASPYTLNVRTTGTYNAAVGTPSARATIDYRVTDTFVAVTLSSSARIKLVGAWLYPAKKPARR